MSKPIKADFKGLVDQALGRDKKSDSIPRAVDGEKKRIPLFETIDLRGVKEGGDLEQIGTTAVTRICGSYTLKKPFMRVSRLIVYHRWTGVADSWNEFGDGDPTSATLVEGLQIFVDGKGLFDEPIKSTADYMKYAYDVSVKYDNPAAGAMTHFTSRLSFFKFMGMSEGIDLSKYDLSVTCDVTDAILGSFGVDLYGEEFKWIFEGWGWDRI